MALAEIENEGRDITDICKVYPGGANRISGFNRVIDRARRVVTLVDGRVDKDERRD